MLGGINWSTFRMNVWLHRYQSGVDYSSQWELIKYLGPSIYTVVTVMTGNTHSDVE
jgi:hypothetical protein